MAAIIDDATFAKRGAIALMFIAFTEALVGFLFVAANGIVVLVVGAAPHPQLTPHWTTLDKWRGLLPFPVPWWIYLVIALALATLLVLTRDPARQYPARMNGKILLHNGPYFLAFWAFFWALLSVGPTQYYTVSGFGLYWIPGVVALAVGVAAVIVGVRQRPARKGKNKKKVPSRAT